MIDRRALRFNKTSVLVLDEFDRMLDMGFVHDIREIVSDMPERTQTMLFSATVEKGQEGIIAELMKDPITVQVSSGKTSTDNVEQDIIQVLKIAINLICLHH
jgi:ATP-dependent RNA helicase RhlE